MNSQPTGKTYPLRTINDIARIPADRRAICVVEILAALRAADSAAEETKRKLAAAKFPRWLEWLRRYAIRNTRTVVENLQWVDDGKFEADVTLEAPGGKIHVSSDDWRKDPPSFRKEGGGK